MISQTRIPPATIARKPRTTITAMAQCGNAESLLDCWMLPDAEGAEDSDETDATDALDSTERVEREDCDIEVATESAYVVSV